MEQNALKSFTNAEAMTISQRFDKIKKKVMIKQEKKYALNGPLIQL